MDDTSPRNKPRWTNVLALAAFALIVRTAVAVALLGSLDADPDAYRKIAENLQKRGIFGSTETPTAFRPPLYPILLAATAVRGTVSPPAIATLHVLLGVATVVMTYLLAAEWGLGRWAVLACGLVTLDPILLRQSSLVMTETLATFLATAALLALTKLGKRPTSSRAATAGALLALASLCRPTFLPWLVLSGIALLLVRRDTRNQFLNPTVLFVTAAVVVSPWVIRNYFVLGAWKVTTTHGGYTVLLGNNPSFFQYLRESRGSQTWDSNELAQVWGLRKFSASPQDAMWNFPMTEGTASARDEIHRTELEDDRFAYSLARRYIADEPGMFAYSCLVRVGRLWQLIPYKTSRSEPAVQILLRVLIGAWYAALFGLAATGICVRRREMLKAPVVWGLLLAFTFTGVHLLYWSNMRMRAPLMPVVCLLATIGADWLIRVARTYNDRGGAS